MAITGTHRSAHTSEPEPVQAVRSEPRDEGWGITTTTVLPGDLHVMLDQPRHATAI